MRTHRRPIIWGPALALVLFLCPTAARDAFPAPAASQQPAASTRSIRVDGDWQMQFVAALSAPEMEGRLTGSPGNKRAQALIIERFKAIKLQPLDGGYQQTFSFTRSGRGGSQEFPDATNLVGVIPGTSEPDSYVIVSAHYDHLGIRDDSVFRGADDNASGVAALLSIAAWIAEHPRRKSVLVIAFDAEEQGLQGARHFVAKPPIDLKRVSAVVNIDMLGRGDAGKLFASGTRHYPQFKDVAADAAKDRQLTLLFGHDTPGTGTDDWTNSSDHGPFHAAGVPFIYFGVEDHPDYHKPTDTADKIPRAFYLEATDVVLDVVARLADISGP